jgi:hypothetical protein
LCGFKPESLSATAATAAPAAFRFVSRVSQGCLWRRVEFSLAACGTEMISLPLVIALRGGGIDIYIHAAHGIFCNRFVCHIISSKMQYPHSSLGGRDNAIIFWTPY